MILPNVSIITRRAYNLPVTFHILVLRSNHEHLRLKRIESRKIRVGVLLARVCQDMRDEVAANVCAPNNNSLGDDLSNDSDYNEGWLVQYDSD